jgi:hypothetical protein
VDHETVEMFKRHEEGNPEKISRALRRNEYQPAAVKRVWIRGCKDALRRADHLLHQGYSWVVDADLKSYFDTIPQERLLARVASKVSDGRVLDFPSSQGLVPLTGSPPASSNPS